MSKVIMANHYEIKYFFLKNIFEMTSEQDHANGSDIGSEGDNAYEGEYSEDESDGEVFQ
jgi:hypothetical protein